MKSNSIELVLTPNATFERALIISWRERMLTVELRLPHNRLQTVVFAIGNPSDGPEDERFVCLTTSANGLSILWAWGAAFDLTVEETAAVRTAFEPFGLRVMSESISTAHLGPRAVKESAPIVRPLGGERGVSLASILGASALDLSNEIGYDG